jgi:hypothetical protein
LDSFLQNFVFIITVIKCYNFRTIWKSRLIFHIFFDIFSRVYFYILSWSRNIPSLSRMYFLKNTVFLNPMSVWRRVYFHFILEPTVPRSNINMAKEKWRKQWPIIKVYNRHVTHYDQQWRGLMTNGKFFSTNGFAINLIALLISRLWHVWVENGYRNV